MPLRAGASQNYTAVLFDSLNTPYLDQMSTRREFLKFLRQLQPQDRVAIYGLGTSLRVLHDFTSDSSALARALLQYAARPASELQASTAEIRDSTRDSASAEETAQLKALDDFITNFSERIAAYYIQRRAEITLRALEDLANHLAALPGRKSLIWISGGFPFSYGNATFEYGKVNEGQKTFYDPLARTARAITDANVALYPVDARLLAGAARMSPSYDASATSATARQQVLASINQQAQDEVLATHNTMTELADKTGGRAIYNTTDMQAAIHLAMKDSRLTYTLGYYPSNGKFDGAFRPIKVTVKRPGARLKYRHGYYAFPNDPSDGASRRDALKAALNSLLDLAAIGFSAKLGDAVAGSPARSLSLNVDMNTVKMELSREQWTGGLELFFTQFDAQRKQLSDVGRQLDLVLTAAQREKLLAEGLPLEPSIELKDNCDDIRIIIRDMRSGAIGTLTIPVNLGGIHDSDRPHKK
jgi:VWFA-related protein